MKRIASFTLAVLLIMLQLELVCSAASQKEKIIVISTAAQLEELAQQCSLDSFSKGLTVELSCDIDLAGSSFSGIPYFCGTFNGHGHTVKHLYLTREGSNIGFIRYTSKDARIRNTNVEGSVEPGGSAAVVGGIAGENDGVISGCKFSGAVKGTESSGGIVGKNSGIISSCSFSGTVSAAHRAGGIAGESSGTVSGCVNSGKINTSLITTSDKRSEISFSFDVSNLTEDDFLDITDIGGIVGFSEGTVCGCSNDGDVGYERIGYNVGGIAGRQNGRVSECTNKGAVAGRKDVGGIVGQAEPYAVWDVSETTLNELKDKLSAIRDDLKAFGGSRDGVSSGIKAAAADLGSCVDDALTDTSAVIDTVSGNISRAESTANDLIASINKAIDDNDPASAEKLLAELAGLVKDPANSIDTSRLGAILEKLHAQDSGHDITLSLRSDLERIGERSETLDKARSGDSKRRSRSGRTINELTADIEAAVDSKDLQNARELADELLSLIESGAESIDTEAVERIIQKLTDLEGTYLGGTDELRSSVEDIITSTTFTRPDVGKLRTDADRIVSSAGQLRSAVKSSSASLKEDAQKLFDSCSALADLFIESDMDVGRLAEDHQTDISSSDSDLYDSGIITLCKNYGDVSAETNAGGIAGNVAHEVDIDAEDQLRLPSYFLQNAQYVVFAVVSGCLSNSDITAKKDCVGGIVGNADFGAVTGCESSGSMHGGDHSGGTAGRSMGSISDSYSRCLLYGESCVGGIAGEGCDISGCRSYSYVKSGKEFSGSVAGKANGAVKACVFVENGVGGIDGISYVGIAEPVSYSEMMKLPDVPEWFKKITVTFVAGDSTVAVKEVEFGGSIDSLPEVKMDGARYWKWNDFDNSHIYYSQTVEGEYKDPNTTIATSEEVPLFLAQGNFYEGQELTATPETYDISIKGEKGKLLGAYTVSVNDFDSVLFVRMRMTEPGKLYMLNEGKWAPIDYTTDGSYIVFDMENGSTIAFFGKRDMNIPKWTIALGTTAILSLIIAVVVRRKRRIVKKVAADED